MVNFKNCLFGKKNKFVIMCNLYVDALKYNAKISFSNPTNGFYVFEAQVNNHNYKTEVYVNPIPPEIRAFYYSAFNVGYYTINDPEVQKILLPMIKCNDQEGTTYIGTALRVLEGDLKNARLFKRQ